MSRRQPWPLRLGQEDLDPENVFLGVRRFSEANARRILSETKRLTLRSRWSARVGVCVRVGVRITVGVAVYVRIVGPWLALLWHWTPTQDRGVQLPEYLKQRLPVAYRPDTGRLEYRFFLTASEDNLIDLATLAGWGEPLPGPEEICRACDIITGRSPVDAEFTAKLNLAKARLVEEKMKYELKREEST